MKFKIIETTDGKYVGEVVKTQGISPVGSELTHKGTTFLIEEIKAKGQYITFYCTNYEVIVKVLEQ